MKRIEIMAGEHISRACERLAKEAPAFMVFNDVRVEAAPGEDPDTLLTRYGDALGQRTREHEASKRNDTERLRFEHERMRAALEEMNENANRILAGDLSWLTRRDIAAAVADRSKAALGPRLTSTEGSKS